MSTISHPILTALSDVLSDAASQRQVPVDDLVVENVQAMEWSDSCLGAPAPGEVCREVVSPGYRIRLGGGVIYHADQRGGFRRVRSADPATDNEIRLKYVISGGIGGWYSEFQTDSWQLSDADEQELRRLVSEADFFQVQSPLPSSPVSDGITRSLWVAVGRLNHEVVRGDGIEVDDSDALGALFAWAEARTPPFGP